MTALYIGQHEIDDEPAFADYLKQTMPFIDKHGGRFMSGSCGDLSTDRW